MSHKQERMKLIALITSLVLPFCISCAVPAATSATPPTAVKTVDKAAKLKALARTCPRDIQLSAYINMMPGPPMGDKPRTASILLTVMDGTGWAVGTGRLVTDGETAMTLNIFRATNQVKPPAKSLKPRRTNSEKAFAEVRFRAPSPDIKRVQVTCFGDIVAETTVHTAH